MSIKLINQQLSSTLHAKLSLLEEQNSRFFPKFNEIISRLLSQKDDSLTDNQLQQLVAKKQFALGKLHGVLPDIEASRRFTARLDSLLADLQSLWGNEDEEHQARAPAAKAADLQLFSSFKRRYGLAIDIIDEPAQTPKEPRGHYLPAPQLKKHGV